MSRVMDRYLFELESVPDGGDGGAAGGDPDPAPPGDVPDDAEGTPLPDPAPPAEPDTPPAAVIDWGSPEAQAAIQAGTTSALQAFLASQQPDDPGFDWGEVNLFDDDAGAKIGQGLMAELRKELDQRLGPVQQLVQRDELRASQEWTGQQFTKLNVPEEDQPVVLYMAGGIEVAANAEGQRIGGEQIMSLAHQQLAAHDKRVGEAAVAKYIVDLKTVEGAPAGSGGTVPAVEGFADDDDELAVARRIMAARAAV